MFDTHCHLYTKELFSDIEDIVNKSHKENVKYILVPGVDLDTSKKTIEITNIYDNMFAGVGIHPTIFITEEEIEKNLFLIEELAKNDNVLAIGEIGLDYYHKVNPERTQKILFEKQLKLSIKTNKSVIIHNRHSTDDVLEILKKLKFNNFQGKLVFHCSEPDKNILELVNKYNFFIGVDGDITFDTNKQDFIKEVPIDRLVLETDSPQLAPTLDAIKDREKINYPYYLPLIANKVSEVKDLSSEEVIEKTTKNALLLFGISSGYN